MTEFTVGTGFIVIVNWIGALVQVTPLLVKVATTLNVDVIGAVLVLVAVKEGTLPVPAVGANPISGVGTVLDQVKTAPVALLVKTMEGTTEPAQYV